MSDDKKYYDILGLREDASQIEIKNAYKNLTKFYHPDIKETGSTEKMKEINIAYKILFNQSLYNQEIEELKKDPEKYKQTRANFPIIFEEEDEEEIKYTSEENNIPKTKSDPSNKIKDIFKMVGSCCIGVIILALLLALLPLEIVVVIILVVILGWLYINNKN